jgi:hypothetical protein
MSWRKLWTNTWPRKSNYREKWPHRWGAPVPHALGKYFVASFLSEVTRAGEDCDRANELHFRVRHVAQAPSPVCFSLCLVDALADSFCYNIENQTARCFDAKR